MSSALIRSSSRSSVSTTAELVSDDASLWSILISSFISPGFFDGFVFGKPRIWPMVSQGSACSKRVP